MRSRTSRLSVATVRLGPSAYSCPSPSTACTVKAYDVARARPVRRTCVVLRGASPPALRPGSLVAGHGIVVGGRCPPQGQPGRGDRRGREDGAARPARAGTRRGDLHRGAVLGPVPGGVAGLDPERVGRVRREPGLRVAPRAGPCRVEQRRSAEDAVLRHRCVVRGPGPRQGHLAGARRRGLHRGASGPHGRTDVRHRRRHGDEVVGDAGDDGPVVGGRPLEGDAGDGVGGVGGDAAVVGVVEDDVHRRLTVLRDDREDLPARAELPEAGAGHRPARALDACIEVDEAPAHDLVGAPEGVEVLVIVRAEPEPGLAEGATRRSHEG